MNVLIVDPSRVFHHLVAEAFADLGVTPIAVTTLEEARGVLASQPVSYVCSSLHLKDGQGVDLCRELRRLPAHVFTPFLLLTADTPSSVREAAFQAGVTDIFEKVHLSELVMFLRRLARQYERTSGQVLVVEDSPSQAEFYAAALESVGLSADVVHDGVTGLEYLRQFSYDLLVTDLVMPGELSGLGLVSQVRRLSGEMGDIPILVMTAYDEPARRVELFYQGVNDYVAKPVSREELVARARSLIHTARALREVRASYRSAQSEIAFRITHDPVTELCNRWHFETLLAEAMAMREAGQSLALIDLSCLKLVNDAGGRDAGDSLLRQAGAALATCFADATCAHLEGARMALLLPPGDAAGVLARLDGFVQSLGEMPFPWRDELFARTAHAGLLHPLESATSAAEAMNMADSACRSAGRHAAAQAVRFDHDNAETADELQQKDAIAPLLDALHNWAFELHQQPLVPTRPGRQGGCEILIRMRAKDGSLILPGLFLPAAELYGIIPRIDRWVTSRSLEWLAGAGRHSVAYVSINLSGLTLTDTGFGAFLREELARTGANPAALQFEVTETAAIGDMPAAHRLLEDMHSLGCSVALDDFGSGLSSLGQLRNLKVDMVKIDGQFVRNLLESPVDQAIVRSICAVAQAAKMQTTAEFVESEAQARLLSEMGVDYLQGYAFGRPAPLLACDTAV